MTGWDDLAAAALLGTDRRPADTTALPGRLGAAAAALPPADPARALLGAAALATPYRRAGRRVATTAAPPTTPAAPEHVRCVPPAAAARLAHLLTLPDRELLRAWLRAAAGGGYRVPADVLPALLDLATRDRALGADVAPVLGERGRWLARQRPDWTRVLTAAAGGLREAVPSAAERAEQWEHGDAATRRSLFAALRTHDPAAARALLTASWRSEDGEDREAFLDALGTGLDDADEALLEQALDDRRKGVRERAVRLLGRLPGSAYNARMRARALAAVRVERRLLRSRLVVTPPEACDRALVRDGVSATPPQGSGTAVGPQAWWVQQLVAATPLSTWTELTGAAPAGVLDLPVDGGWGPVLLQAWTGATLRSGDPAWADALRTRVPATGRDLPSLIALLDPHRRAEAAADGLRRRGTPRARVDEVLALVPGPWPPALADAALAWLAAAPGRDADGVQRERLRLLAHRLPPEAATHVRALAERLDRDSSWRPAVLEVAAVLTVRHAMLEELR